MRRSEFLIAPCVLMILAIVPGCGGGGPGDSGAAGVLAIGVRFPQEAAAKIPANAESVRVQVLTANGTARRLVPDTILDKPSSGGLVETTIRSIPVGDVIVRAIAHPQPNGEGPALASAQAGATIKSERTTTVTLALETIVDRVVATPSELVMLVGEKAQVVAHALDATGAVIIDATLDLSSDDPSVATIDSSGVVEANSLGTTTLHARHAESGLEATVSVKVVGARIVRVEVTCEVPATAPGHPVQFSALAYDDLDRPHPNAVIDWSLDDPGSGTIDDAGKFRPNQVGRLRVIATERSSGVAGYGEVTVSEWVVLMRWAQGGDPDLHVFDATQTNHAYYGQPDVPIGTLLVDEIAAPGVEAFAGNRSAVGRYPVAVNYFRGQGTLSGEVTLLAIGEQPVTAPFTLTRANGDDGYPVTVPTASWARPFDVVIPSQGLIAAETADTTIALGPPGSRVKP